MADSAISVKNLTKKFNHSLVAVDDVSFEVPKGITFAFLGPNGAGKTTTIKMLTTLLPATSGTILVNGFDPRKSAAAVRRSFGIVFQDPSLDDELTAYENMFLHAGLYGVSRSATPGKIEELMKFVELWERKDNLVKTFSGGMKRRLEIARGLLHTPAVLFLDEPTVGLDPQTRNHIWSYIKKLNQERGLTVFFTTHYMDEVERTADKVAIIDHGKLIANDTVANIIASSGTPSLEEAFIKLTGHGLREEEAGSVDQLRQMARAWGRGRR
ncbi:MAG: ATP-binding cassette domain-containing protein [Patescibacteria group bacterium]|nr:ATP-binding cassette domain-containing protein [Patescibacteria group bacterium]MDE2172371.1 ATP-binding cassette domain-containing protein [Patescibacteria group bacterium]